MERKQISFVPYHELGGIPNIIVDGRGNPDTLLTLSHWPKSGTPWTLKADTSVEIVFNYLSSSWQEQTKEVTAVSNNHFDEEGLLALWAILNPEKALSRQDLLIAAARAGDFSICTDSHVAKIVFTIAALAHSSTSPLPLSTALLYESLLPSIEEVLSFPDRYASCWKDQFDSFYDSERLLAFGWANLSEVPEVDLAILESEGPFHPMALCSATQMLRLLTIHKGGIYQLRYRYETWVQLVSRRPMPRIDLAPLLPHLQQMETNRGQWLFDGVDALTPRLWFKGPDGNPAPSSIDQDVFIGALIDYLTSHGQDSSLQWDPFD